MPTKCCWCGYEKTKYYCPPYGMVCGEMCASIVCVVEKVRFPEEKKDLKKNYQKIHSLGSKKM